LQAKSLKEIIFNKKDVERNADFFTCIDGVLSLIRYSADLHGFCDTNDFRWSLHRIIVAFLEKKNYKLPLLSNKYRYRVIHFAIFAKSNDEWQRMGKFGHQFLSMSTPVLITMLAFPRWSVDVVHMNALKSEPSHHHKPDHL
jgi:hypothetical protein